MPLVNPLPATGIVYNGGTVADALNERAFVLVFSHQFSSAQNIYLFHGRNYSHISPARMAFDAKITGVGFKILRGATLPAATDIEIYKNADITGSTPTEGNAIVDEVFALGTDGGFAAISPEVDVDAGDILGCYVRSAGQVQFPNVSLYCRRR